MKNLTKIILPTGMLLASTIGAGIFALPSVFAAAGWGLSLAYLALVVLIIIGAHYLFWRALREEDDRHELFGLVREKLGKAARYPALLAIIGGLTLTLVAYLLLGGRFLGLLFPLSGNSIFIFWLLASLPALFSLKRFAKLETSIVFCLAAIILFVFFSASEKSAIFTLPAVNSGELFLPFGALLFSLAGWTAISPIAELNKKDKFSGKPVFLWLGTALAGMLYFLFVAGVFGSAPRITPDTISGLTSWPAWKVNILGILGFLATLSVYWAISHEIKNSLERDVRWGPTAAAPFVVFSPIFLVWAGLKNFGSVIGLVGGVFLAAQYFFIVLVSRKILRLNFYQKILANVLLLVFALGALYEIYYFAVK